MADWLAKVVIVLAMIYAVGFLLFSCVGIQTSLPTHHYSSYPYELPLLPQRGVGP